MKKISVLGTGMVGSAIVRDLEPDFDVLAVDQDESRLGQLQKHCRCRTLRADLSDAERVREICSRQDLVVGAVPGFMGFETLRAVIESGTDIVDISFFSQDSFELDHLAREHGVTAIVDCGIVPGLSNMFLGSHTAREEVLRYECLVGGLPFRRTQPFEYKAPFSPIDVIEEYLRPARMVVGGRIIEKPALSERDYIDFDPIGTLEAFNTDGLRTLLTTVEVPNMVEKTLRYPGHADQMLMLRETGFFSSRPIEIGGQRIRPIDLTSRLLFPAWKLEDGEAEFTAMRLTIDTVSEGTVIRHLYRMFDRNDKENGVSSMARTTGYTCTATVRALAKGAFSQKGIIAPEFVGQNPEAFTIIRSELDKRGVQVDHNEEIQ